MPLPANARCIWQHDRTFDEITNERQFEFCTVENYDHGVASTLSPVPELNQKMRIRVTRRASRIAGVELTANECSREDHKALARQVAKLASLKQASNPVERLSKGAEWRSGTKLRVTHEMLDAEAPGWCRVILTNREYGRAVSVFEARAPWVRLVGELQPH